MSTVLFKSRHRPYSFAGRSMARGLAICAMAAIIAVTLFFVLIKECELIVPSSFLTETTLLHIIYDRSPPC